MCQQVEQVKQQELTELEPNLFIHQGHILSHSLDTLSNNILTPLEELSQLQ